MIVGRKYTASSEIGSDRTFWCLQCEFKCPALILGVGSATTTSYGIWHNEGAARSAVTEAKEAAQEDANKTFGLIPCPRCGATDPLTTHRFRVAAAWRSVLAGLVCGLVGYIIAHVNAGYRNPRTTMLCALGASIGFAAGAALSALERVMALSSHRGRAKLFPDQPPSADMSRL